MLFYHLPLRSALIHWFRRRGAPPLLDVPAAYAHWAQAYPARPHNPLMALEQAALESLLPESLAGRRCLDLAGGTGRYAHVLRQRGAAGVVCLDLSAPMLAAGQPPAAVQGAFLALPLASAQFDLIVCGLAVGHEANLAGLMAEAARLLRPGGCLLYSDLHPVGAALGWQRTFAAGGARLRVAHHPHWYSAHHHACRQAGLVITAVTEPRLGSLAPRPDWQDVPAVLVIRAGKAP